MKRLEAKILSEHSKTNALNIVSEIGTDQQQLEHLMTLFFQNITRTAQIAAYVVHHYCDAHPEMLTPFVKRLIQNMGSPMHVAVKRCTLRILQLKAIPTKLQGKVANICFEYMVSQEESIAIKVYSMTVLHNLCKTEPDLSNELRLIIEEQMPYASAGFKSRGKKILKDLNQVK